MTSFHMLNFKLSRNTAGRHFPWDRVYVCRSEHVDTAKRCTPNNLRMQIRGDLKELFKELIVTESLYQGVGREQHAVNLRDPRYMPSISLTGRNDALKNMRTDDIGDKTLKDFMDYLQSEKTLSWDEESPWYAIIPVLGVFTGKAQRPAYLMNKNWAPRNQGRGYAANEAFARTGLSNHRTVEDHAVLKVLNTEHTPPCVACDRGLMHMAGKCEIGGPTCLRSMSFSRDSYFQSKMHDTSEGLQREPKEESGGV